MPAALGVDLRTWRRALHERAETAFGEVRTAEYLAEVLGSLGLRVVRGVGGTGLVASLSRGVSDRAVGIRADMDALPLTERGDPGTSPRTPCPPARAAERLSPQHEAASPAKPPRPDGRTSASTTAAWSSS